MDPLEGISQPDSACFIVYNSQEEESEMLSDPIQMLEKLPALRDPEMSDKRDGKDVKSSRRKLQEEDKYEAISPPRKNKFQPERLGRQVPGSSNEGSDDDIPGDVPQAPGGNDPPPGGPGGGGGNNQGAGAGGAAGGDGGGDGGGEGGQQGEGPPDDSDEEEEHAEPLQSSTDSGGSIPPLMTIQPSTSTGTPPRSLPRHFTGHHQTPSTSRDDSGYGPSAAHQPPRVNGDSESEGGLSEASTAVVSDTEGHGQIIQPRSSRGRSHGHGTQSPGRSPGRSPASGSPRAREAAHDTSSALSTLSSYTSSSSSECPQAETSARKRGAPKKLAMPPSKKTRVDTSTSSSSSEAKQTTSPDTSKSRDTSGDTSTGEDRPPERSRDPTGDTSQDVSGDIGSSQQDMFAEDPDTSGKQEGPTEDLPPILTPADHLESLNFSGQHTSPTTDSHIFGPESFPLFSPTQSLGYVPASQETFSSSVPYLIPGSPTDTSPEDYGSQRFRAALGGVRKVTKKSFQDLKEDRARMPPPRLEKETDQVVLPEAVEPREVESVGSNNGSDKSRNGSSSNSGSLRPSSLNIPEGQPMESISYPESEVSDGNGSRQGPEDDPPQPEHERSEDLPRKNESKDKAESQGWGLHYTSTQQHSLDDSEITFPHLQTSQSQSQRSESRSQKSQDTSQSRHHSSREKNTKESSHTSQASQDKRQYQTSQKSQEKQSAESQSSTRSQDRSQRGRPQHEELPPSLKQRDSDTGEGAHRRSLEEPEIPRMVEGGEEEDEDMVLLLSQTQATQYTQHTQSQYSVGVASILERLKSTQGEVAEEKDAPDVEGFSESQNSQSSQQSDILSQKASSSKSQDLEDLKRPPRSLTLDMVETQDEDNTEMSVPMFQLKRPSLESDAYTQESEPVTSSSVFRRAREVREKQQEAKNAPGSKNDPFAFSSQSYERQKSHDSLQDDRRKEERPKIAKSSQPTPKKSKWPTTQSSSTTGGKSTSARRKLEAETTGNDSEDDVIYVSSETKDLVDEEDRPTTTLDGDETQDYDFTTIKGAEEPIETVPDDDSLPDIEEEVPMDVDTQVVRPTQERKHSETEANSDKLNVLKETSVSEKREPSQTLPVSQVAASSQNLERSGSSQRSVGSHKLESSQRSVKSQQSASLRKAPSEEASERRIEETNTEVHLAASIDSEIIPPTDQAAGSKSKREATPLGKYRAKKDTYTKDSSKKSKNKLPATPSEQKTAHASNLGLSDTLNLRPQDTFRLPRGQTSHSAPPTTAPLRHPLSTEAAGEGDDTQILDVDELPEHRPVDGGQDERRTGDGEPVAPRSSEANERGQPSRASEQREPVPSTSASRDNSGPGDVSASSSQSGTVLHYTTITTVIHNTVQMVETRVNGRIVTCRYSSPVAKIIEVINEVHDEHVSEVSPSRTTHSLTSGDLADVSSLSKSTGTKTGSSFTSPHNLTSSSPATFGSGSGSSGHSRARVSTAEVAVQTDLPEPVKWRSMDSLPTLPSDSEMHPPMLRCGSSSSGSYIKPADLSSQPHLETATKRKSSSSTGASSLHQSSSLFSTSPEVPHPSTTAMDHSEAIFQKPEPPVSTPRAKPQEGDAPRRPPSPEVEAQELEYEQKVDSQDGLTPKGVKNWGDRVYSSHRGRPRGRGRGRGRGRTLVPKSQPSQESEISEIPDIRPISPPPRRTESGPPKLEPAVITQELAEGMSVFALWDEDDHFYHGQLGELLAPGTFRIKFDDGNAAAVKEAEVFASSRLAEGEQVMVQHRLGSCFDNATIINTDTKGEETIYEVEFSSKSRKTVPVRKMCLTREQGMTIKNKPERKREQMEVERESGAGRPVSPTPTRAATAHSSRSSRQQQRRLHPREKAVYAMFTDRFYYPGYMVNEETDGRFTIAYEDGDTHRVRDIYIIHCDLLPVGQSVFAERNGEEGSVPGFIVQVFDEPQEEWGYSIEFPDGTKERLLRSQVILTHEQALALKASTPTLSSTPKISDVTLDNLVAGKRRRNVATPASPIVREGSTPGRPASAITPRTSRKILASGQSSRKGKKRMLTDPQSSPTPKRRLGVGDWDDPEYVAIPFESPPHVRKSNRRTKQDIAYEAKGPIPAKGSKLFENMAFLLTHVDRTPLQRAQERQMAAAAGVTSDFSTVMNLNDTTSEVDEDDVVDVPFDKDHLEDQIKYGGGHVLTEFIKDQLKLYSKCLLISDSHQRTLKYFFCLAANVPCVSHVWIRDSCRAGKQQDYKNYILPAGISIETEKLIEARLNPIQPLKKMSVIVSTKNQRFQKMWTQILETAGCRVYNAPPDELFVVEVLVTDRDVDDRVLVTLLQADIPVVSSEWAIQCLITGRRVPYTKHQRYRHDYEEP